MKKLIINADDFGLNTSVNNAIIKSFDKGLITGTTLMANMQGFNEAVELAHQNNIINKTGIHLCLTEGKPITNDILKSNLYNLHNSDIKKFKKRIFFLTINQKKIIYKEFQAQIIKVRKAGINITHIDTHLHTHEVWSITKIVFALLKEYNIPSMRILNNLNKSTGFYKSAYRKFINNRIKIKGINHSDYFGNQLQAIHQYEKNRMFFDGKTLEIMVHPDFNNKGIIIDKINGREINFNYPGIFK